MPGSRDRGARPAPLRPAAAPRGRGAAGDARPNEPRLEAADGPTARDGGRGGRARRDRGRSGGGWWRSGPTARSATPRSSASRRSSTGRISTGRSSCARRRTRDRRLPRRPTMKIKRSGSQPSGKGPADWFTGTVRIDPLFAANAPARGGRQRRHLRARRAHRMAHASPRADADRHLRPRPRAA